MSKLGELFNLLIYYIGYGVGYVVEWCYWIGQGFLSGWRDGREAAAPKLTAEQEVELSVMERIAQDVVNSFKAAIR